jgi:hypothetical protein
MNKHSLIFLLAMVTSCSPALYIPNVVNVPAFTEEKQLQVSGFVGLDHVEIQGAFNPHKSIGLMANYYLGNAKFYDLGIGGLIPYKDFRFELFAGYGYAKLRYYRKREDPFIGPKKITDLQGRYHRYFVQPNIAYVHTAVTIAVSMRTNYLIYDKYHYYYEEAEYYDPSTTYPPTIWEINEDGKNAITIEPAITLKAGNKYVKAFVQAGAVVPLAKEDQYAAGHSYNHFIGKSEFLNTGLQLSLGLAKKKTDGK